jgi:hypothetical protein
MGLEGWMAFAIAREVGLRISRPSDIWTYFGLLGGVGITILSLFKVLLGFAFSLFAFLPGLNPLIPAELLVTNLVGVMFWFGFRAALATGRFHIPGSAVTDIWRLARDLFKYQASVLRKGLSPRTLKSMGMRVSSWLKGELPASRRHARGELLAVACMAYLLAGRYEGLSGPMGDIFLQAIRDRYPMLAHLSIEEIAEQMRGYDAQQMQGVISLIKGRMFELYEIEVTNGRGGSVHASSEPDMNHPGDDIILHDDTTGHDIFIQLKATDSASYVEEALHRYPDVPILTTDEVSHHFELDDRVTSAGVTNAHLEAVTHENFHRLVEKLEPISAINVAAGGVAARATARLWPFFVAYMRRHISYSELEEAMKRVLGDSGAALAARVSYSLAFDALFGWYLLARGVLKIVQAGQAATQERPQKV